MVENINIQNYQRILIDFSPTIPKLQKIDDKTGINLRYNLIYPYASVHIYWEPKISELMYEIEEPVLDEQEIIYREEITAAMRDIINFDTIIEKEPDKLMEYIDKIFKLLATELRLEISYESYKKIFYYLCRDFVGFNEVDPLLRDFFVEDVECNGASTPVYLVHRI